MNDEYHSALLAMQCERGRARTSSRAVVGLTSLFFLCSHCTALIRLVPCGGGVGMVPPRAADDLGL